MKLQQSQHLGEEADENSPHANVEQSDELVLRNVNSNSYQFSVHALNKELRVAESKTQRAGARINQRTCPL